jgi:nicotinamidase-related amidase
MPDHAAAPGRAALLIIDALNAFDFEGAEDLLPRAEIVAERIAALADEARMLGVPVIYVNDNHGRWTSDRRTLIEATTHEGAIGRGVARRLEPRDEDLFVIKPQVSGFYATNLPVVLPQLGADRLVLTGFATDICVLFTAADAHMRDYALWVPPDAVAAESEDRQRWAMEIMGRNLGADVRPSAETTLRAFVDKRD